MTFEGMEEKTATKSDTADSWEALPGASRLTLAQREAIESDQPLLCVVAGAGAGKTRVLTLRVARRVRDGSIDADRTLVTTFSRKAADELRTRLWSLGVSGVRAGTFHRTALGLLREHRELRGRPAPQLMPDRRRLLADITTGDPRRTRALDGEIGWAKARLVPPDQYEGEARRHRRRSGVNHDQVAEIYARYEEERTKRRLLDFDDLIVACADALAGDSEFADSIRWRSRHLFVDEMQDVNPAQFRLLSALLSDDPDLFVVGDPNQSVYGFNGADPTLLDRLPEILRGTKVIRLDENHRCTPQVVAVATEVLRDAGDAAASEVVPPRSSRVDGPVPKVVSHATDEDEATWAARQVKLSRAPGRPWSSIAVLTRTNAQLTTALAAMEAAGVPAAVAGADLGPASDLRGEGSHRGARAGAPGTAPHAVVGWTRRRPRRRRGTRTGTSRPRGALDVSPGQGPAVADRARARPEQWADAPGLGPDAGCRGGGASPALRGPDPLRGRALVQLVRTLGDRAWRGRARAEPVVGPHRAGHRGARQGGCAGGRLRGVDPGGGAAPPASRGRRGLRP